jgi:uncharacterized protein (DUF305 family)
MSIPFDQEFIDMMVKHHQSAVEMAKVAQERAEHDELRKFADEMVVMQDSEIVRMEEWRRAWFGGDSATATNSESGPADMAMEHSGDMKEGVEGLRSADPFDKAFIEAMIPHHQSAVDMASKAEERAEHAEIKRLAAEIVAAQTREVSTLKSWLDAWY